MNEINHKTIFVLDHTPYFGISSEDFQDLDIKNFKSPISKSLWTCSNSAAVEYCRIVWDLFPTDKLIRFVVSDSAAHIVNTWNASTQNITHVMNALSMVGVPPRTSNSEQSVIHGLRAAIEGLAEPTDFQKEVLLNSKNTNSNQLVNKGRVICITSARDDSSMNSLSDIFLTVLVQQNKISAAHPDLLTIDFCHLVIINLYPKNIESFVSNRSIQEVSPNLATEIHSTKASKISYKLTQLILPHYDLASTTVTGIPMKEEQNASSSANYDVEIFHSSRGHLMFLGTDIVLPRSLKEGYDYETVTLKWCTPRNCGLSEMQPCLAQHRVTPVDVTSRPSSCLINFLLNGRSVLLEMPKKSGGKITSHLLSAHGGEIFLHSLNISRSCLEDPPSISEGIGGRVTDYRITDFAAHMRANKLVPLRPLPDRVPDENLTKLRFKIGRNSRYFPITLSTTIVYNLKQFVEPFVTLIQKPELNEEETLKCQQTIYNIIALEARQEPLTLPNMGHRMKNKKEDQYRLLWNELEAIVVASSGKSMGHKTVMQCLRECRTSTSGEKGELDQALREFDTLNDFVRPIKATTDSPMSPPHVVMGPSTFGRVGKKSQATNTKSLLDIYMTMERQNSNKRLDFSGRLCTPPGQKAKLYPHLKEPSARETDVK